MTEPERTIQPEDPSRGRGSVAGTFIVMVTGFAIMFFSSVLSPCAAQMIGSFNFTPEYVPYIGGGVLLAGAPALLYWKRRTLPWLIAAIVLGVFVALWGSAWPQGWCF